MDKIQHALEFRSFNRATKDAYRELFIASNDPSGYTFAEEWVEDGYRKWKSMTTSYGVKEEVAEWKETLEIKLQAQAVVNIAKQRDNFQSLKWLADKGWSEKQDMRTKVARKKKEELDDHIAGDMARLGLVSVKK